ncbi:MAG: 50S ribosomal protein L6 [Bacilli bacterium]|jgi:large subunit ribosomal protein L6
MSRIGRKPVVIPAGVTITTNANVVTVKGPKGELKTKLDPHITYETKGTEFLVKRPDDSIKMKMNHGTARAIINDMVEGVTNGFTKELEIKGVGYRGEMRGTDLVLHVGHSHEDVVTPLTGVAISIKQSVITVTGIDKQAVGQMAAMIRNVRKPECYHGKGIRYKNEVVVLRQPASAKKSAVGATATGAAAPAAK